MTKPSFKALSATLEYMPDTGVFIWKSRVGSDRSTKIFNTKYVGCRAGVVDPRGYRYIKIWQKMYAEGHLAWVFSHKEWPAEEIDHINGDPSDNRLCNIRPATRSQNGANRGLHVNSVSGCKGVYYSRRHNRWVAQAGGRERRLTASCSTKEEAVSAYAELAKQLYGDFARLA